MNTDNQTTTSQPAADAGKPFIVTHDGVFHADELVAIVLLIAAKRAGFDNTPTFKAEINSVVRTRNPELIATAEFAIDVGGEHNPETGRFDHHQWRPEDPDGLRPSGKRWAAAGLVWRHYGDSIVRRMLTMLHEEMPDDAPWDLMLEDDDLIARAVAQFDKDFIRHIDAADNGESEPGGYSISQALAAFNPPAFLIVSESEMTDTVRHCFLEAAKVALSVTMAALVRALDTSWAQTAVRNSLLSAALDARFDGRVMELEKFAPWQDEVRQLTSGYGTDAVPTLLGRAASRVELIIFPRPQGDWIVQCVPPVDDPKGKRLVTRAADGTVTPGLPVEWASLTGDALAAASGVADAVFCHVNRFMAVAGSKDGALAMCRAALKAAGYQTA